MSTFCLGRGNSMTEGERFCESVPTPRRATVTPRSAGSARLPPETSGKAVFSLICGVFPSSSSRSWLSSSDTSRSEIARVLTIERRGLGSLESCLACGWCSSALFDWGFTAYARLKGNQQRSGFVTRDGCLMMRTLNMAEIA